MPTGIIFAMSLPEGKIFWEHGEETPVFAQSWLDPCRAAEFRTYEMCLAGVDPGSWIATCKLIRQELTREFLHCIAWLFFK